MAATDVARPSRLPASGWLETLLHRLGIRGRTLVIAIPFLWLLLYFFLPFLIVLKVSLAFITIAQPPYTHFDDAGNFVLNIGRRCRPSSASSSGIRSPMAWHGAALRCATSC